MCVLAIFFFMVSSHCTPNCSAVLTFMFIHLPHDKLKNSAFVGNSGHFDIEVKLTVDVEMAKLHISRPVRLWCGDYTAGLCWVSVGLKIHAESSSNGSSRPASHITGALCVR